MVNESILTEQDKMDLSKTYGKTWQELKESNLYVEYRNGVLYAWLPLSDSQDYNNSSVKAKVTKMPGGFEKHGVEGHDYKPTEQEHKNVAGMINNHIDNHSSPTEHWLKNGPVSHDYNLTTHSLMEPIINDPVSLFERRIAAFFGAPYAVAVDSCTHGLELCLRYEKAQVMHCPHQTYLSVPMLADKLGLRLYWHDWDWKDWYCIYDAPTILVKTIDAAVFWKANGYIKNTFMCISFQYQKHLSLGRGGMIICDNKEAALQLKKMSYDGRVPGIPWREQNVDTIGYHYYMTPETAELGLSKLDEAIATEPRKWRISDWPDLTEMKVFKK